MPKIKRSKFKIKDNFDWLDCKILIVFNDNKGIEKEFKISKQMLKQNKIIEINNIINI